MKKALNFADEEVACSSEGGTWSVSVGKVTASSPLTGEIALPSSSSSSPSTSSGGEELKKDLSLALELLFLPSNALNVAVLCDRIDAEDESSRASQLLRLKRSSMLSDLLYSSRDEYLETVSFLSSRIPRGELPNLQGVPIADYAYRTTSSLSSSSSSSAAVAGEVADCRLPSITYQESPLDKALLAIFRSLVQAEVKYKSPKEGIVGLLDEGRTYMLSAEGTPENQHAFVRRTLGSLMTPFLPPFYRLFMSGIAPSEKRGDPKWLEDAFQSIVRLLPEGKEEEKAEGEFSFSLPTRSTFAPGKQFGPLFYAPALTSFITPVFLNFLVGPSRANRRKDGQLGGLVVEKCKFLQESGCKGLCLHQCKLPAQQFFADTLGLPLTVEPNFETQECQWSWGEVPLPADEDPSFPAGCLSGCPTKKSASSSSSTLSLSKLCSA